MNCQPKTFEDWQEFAQALHARAYALRLRLVRAMNREMGAAFGGGEMEASAHLARNWLGQAWVSPSQAQAMRRVLWLHKQSSRPEELAGRITSRALARLGGWRAPRRQG